MKKTAIPQVLSTKKALVLAEPDETTFVKLVAVSHVPGNMRFRCKGTRVLIFQEEKGTKGKVIRLPLSLYNRNKGQLAKEIFEQTLPVQITPFFVDAGEEFETRTRPQHEQPTQPPAPVRMKDDGEGGLTPAPQQPDPPKKAPESPSETPPAGDDSELDDPPAKPAPPKEAKKKAAAKKTAKKAANKTAKKDPIEEEIDSEGQK